MGIDKVHLLFDLLISKETNGELTHAEIDKLLNRASFAHFNELFNNPQRWRVDKQLGQIYYGGSERINTALSPFKVTQPYTTGDTPGGVLTLDDDFLHFIALRATVYDNDLARNVNYPVDVLNELELVDRLESQVSPVALTNPIAIMNSNRQIQLFPETTQSGKVYYFKKPVECVYAYTQSGRAVTFDDANSVDLEWNDLETYNILTTALSYAGVKLSATDVTNFAEAKKQQGE